MAKEKKKAQEVQEPVRRGGGIRARVIEEKKGLQLIADVGAVRVRSREYSLLIMEDYMPALGEIDGTITFLTGDGERVFPNIKGFYKHQHNEFTLLIEGGEEKASGGKEEMGS